MTVFYLPDRQREGGDPEAQVRIGFTVPRSLGGAVDRNRMRRRTREAVRHHLRMLEGIRGSVDVVINPKKSLLVAEFPQISREVERAFGVIRRVCDDPEGNARSADQRAPRRQRRRGAS